jgi:hypothetical protein
MELEPLSRLDVKAGSRTMLESRRLLVENRP